ncbi:DUF3881 family protein [bacterium]|nr:DUF3881 family protein [bacterium]MDY2886749.1 DUF3881 family protein [Bariatricus sp.]
MHKYLKAIGFQNVTSEKEWNRILIQSEEEFTDYQRISLEEELDFGELRKEYGMGIGIYSYGQIDEYETYTREYYLPYFEGNGITSYADIIVEKRSDKEAYIGICEDVKVGVSLIFPLQNGIEYRKELMAGRIPKNSTSVTLSGLAVSGTILFPVMKSKEQEQEIREESRNRMMLLSAAREGDSKAIESLTMEDMDLYSQVSRRVQTEDIYSIVDTYFMPCGVECDQYSILGEILDIDTVENKLTKEEIYVFTVDVNELRFDICVPVKSVLGEPAIGRRIKADIWLQGKINL